MISTLPWKLDKEDPSIIYDAEDNIIAKDYKFIHVDDFEAICSFTNEYVIFLHKECVDPDAWVCITGSIDNVKPKPDSA